MRKQKVIISLLLLADLGCSPLMSFITYMLDFRDEYKKVMIIYGAVNPTSILFKNDIQYWSSRDDISVCLTVDNPDEKWTGEIGVCTKLIPRVDFLQMILIQLYAVLR